MYLHLLLWMWMSIMMCLFENLNQSVDHFGKKKGKGKLSHGQYSRAIRQQGMVIIVFQVLSRQSACTQIWMVDHTSSTTCHYLPSFYTGTKLYCLVTEAHGCEQLAQSCYLIAARPGIELTTSQSRIRRPNHYITRWMVQGRWSKKIVGG